MPWPSPIARRSGSFIGSMFKHVGVTGFRRSPLHFSSTFTNRSSNLDTVLRCWRGADHKQSPGRSFFSSAKMVFTNTALLTSVFRIRANNLVMWPSIQFLVCQGVRKLHFGRTDCENSGLRRFKLSWDTEEETIDYFRVDPSGQQLPAFGHAESGFHKRIFGKLPLMFNRLAGSMTIPTSTKVRLWLTSDANYNHNIFAPG